MVNVLKEVFDVAFQYPSGFCMILADFIGKATKTIEGFMRPLVFSAGKRIRDESSVEKRIEFAVNRMVQKAVSDSRFVDIPRLGVGDVEGAISSVFIFPLGQISVKC